MSFVFLTFFILISSVSSSQPNLEKQVKLLLRDSVNCFSNYKADFKELQETDSVFNSKIILDQTTRNDILISKEMCMYMVVIADSTKEKNGRKLVEDWKNKMYFLKGSGFQLKQKKYKAGILQNMDIYSARTTFM